jgi:hypothetical protein
MKLRAKRFDLLLSIPKYKYSRAPVSTDPVSAVYRGR